MPSSLSVDDVLHLLVHDVRNPLNVLLQNVRFVSESIVDPDERDAAQDALSAGASIERMLANAVDVLCESSPLTSAVLNKIQLARLCARVASSADPRVKVEPIAASLTVQADEKILARMLATLLDNALRHSQASVRLSAGLNASADRVVIRITDEGSSVPQELVPIMFDAGARLHENAKRMRPEPCFGLTAAQLAAKRMHGSLTVDHTASGHTFIVELPGRA